MKQLGDLGKTLSDALSMVETFQQELDRLRAENDALQSEIKSLRDESATLRAENEKIYLEMNNLRAAKDDLRAANDAFTGNLNQLVNNLNANHEKTMAHISQLVNDGLQKFVVDYVNTISNAAPVPADTAAEIVVDDAEVLPDTDTARKPRMQYAGFYAESNVEADTGSEIKLGALPKPRKK